MSKDSLKERVRLRLDTLGKSARCASLDAGLGADAVRNVLSDRSRYPRGDTLRDLAKALDCSIDWLITGRQDSFTHSKTVSVPEIDVHAGMGGGGDASVTYIAESGSNDGNMMAVDNLRGDWLLPDDYLRNELRIEAQSARIIEVRGDSMEPTLRSGDRVMVDVSDKRLTPPGIFALWDGFGVVVKRLEHVPNSSPPTLRIKSDNKLHDDYERTSGEINIIGRVVWYTRRL